MYGILQPPGELVNYRDNHITRIFRNLPGIQYEGMLHETVIPSIEHLGGRVDKVDIVIHHTGYLRKSVQGSISRSERNLELLQKMETTDPGNTYIHYQLGKTYQQQRNYSEARIHFSKALEQADDNLSMEILDEIYMKMAQIDLAQNREEDCINNALRSLDQSPNNVISMYLLALSYMQQERIEEAYGYFLKIRNVQAGLVQNAKELDVVIAYCEKRLKETNQH